MIVHIILAVSGAISLVGGAMVIFIEVMSKSEKSSFSSTFLYFSIYLVGWIVFGLGVIGVVIGLIAELVIHLL